MPETDRQRGLYRKYRVHRCDCTDFPGMKHERCEKFVLDLDHDPYAVPAMRSYGLACQPKFPALAADIVKWLHTRPAPPAAAFDPKTHLASELVSCYPGLDVAVVVAICGQPSSPMTALTYSGHRDFGPAAKRLADLIASRLDLGEPIYQDSVAAALPAAEALDAPALGSLANELAKARHGRDFAEGEAVRIAGEKLEVQQRVEKAEQILADMLASYDALGFHRKALARDMGQELPPPPAWVTKAREFLGLEVPSGS